METKLIAYKIDFVKRRLLFEGCLVVDSRGRSGGLVMMWEREMEVEVVNFSTYHIHVKIKDAVSNLQWWLTDFYGHPNTCKRRCTWSCLN